MAEASFEVLWPLGRAVYETSPMANREADLKGKTVCEIWDWLFRGDEVFPIVRELLSKRYPGIKFVGYDEFGNTNGPKQREIVARLPELLKARGCDAVISALGS